MAATTRIVVKNLPSWITEAKLREVFEQKGCLTDCSIKYNANGKSRRFAFIGYSAPEEADAAIKYFDNSCIGTSRVRVEVCKNLTDATSKHTGLKKDGKQPIKQKTVVPEDLASDPKFAEFIQLHQHGDKVWENDLVVKNADSQPASATNKGDNDTVDVPQSGSTKKEGQIEEPAMSDAYAAMVKLKDLPFNVSKEQIKQFFCGIDIKRILIGVKKRKPGENSAGYVEFTDVKAVDQALRRNKSFLGGKKILVLRVVRPSGKSDEGSAIASKKSSFPVRNAQQIAADVSDSGRLFVRNLSYLCTEDDIQELFAKFGELSEVYLPLEKLTKHNKGFAFVSYLMPEHAVKALNELDGTSFQGRMLHIIPAEGKPESEKTVEGTDKAGSSFKSNKESALKQSANSSHNWNALFVGTNAVIDSVASEYGADKKQIFEQSGAAVRMALGETEIVLKTKKFLEDHGVHLEAFGKPVVKRSKTIILVKNLPARTAVDELREMFEKYGTIVRLVLPPSGVTGVVEFSDSNEAKSAFRSLAYRRFKDLPLYLEWAPVDVFLADAPLLNVLPQPQETPQEKPVETKETSVEISAENSSSNVPPVVPVVGEGNATVFVKNLNFKTSEEGLSEFFSGKFPGKVVRATIAKNKDSHRQMISLGYGFVEFADSQTAQDALKKMQHSELDGHKLELKISTSNASKSSSNSNDKSSNSKNAGANHPSTRILVRNIPFEANAKDVQELFAVFGNLRSVRLPKKAVVQAVGSVSGRSGGGRSANLHRGFGFVDFHSIEEAKRAFDALRHSTHFYGRRLVLEWAKTDEADLVDELRAKAAERAVASAAAAAGAVHAGAAKRLRKADMIASVEHQVAKTKEDVEMD